MAELAGLTLPMRRLPRSMRAPNAMRRTPGMKLRFTERAAKDYAGMPVAIRKAFGKQLRFLLVNRRHPPAQPVAR